MPELVFCLSVAFLQALTRNFDPETYLAGSEASTRFALLLIQVTELRREVIRVSYMRFCHLYKVR